MVEVQLLEREDVHRLPQAVVVVVKFQGASDGEEHLGVGP